MSVLRKILLIVSVLSLPTLSIAQIEVGGWRIHSSFNNTLTIAQSPERVYGLSYGTLFYFDKDEYEVQTMSKVEGLNDSKIASIVYADNVKALVIAYSDGNIDLLYDDGDIVNVPDIKNSSISTDKTPSDLLYDSETGYVYISGEIGIIVFNPVKKEIADTYVIGAGSSYQSISSLALSKDSIYALTLDSIKSASRNEKMLVNSELWETVYTGIKNTKQLEYYNGKLFLLSSSGELYSQDVGESTWKLLGTGFISMSVSSAGELVMGTDNSVVKLDSNGNELSRFNGLYSACVLQDLKSSSRLWVAAGTLGVVELQNQNIVQTIKPSGPAYNDVFSLKYFDGRVYAMTGNPRCYSASDVSKTGAVMIFENESWKNIMRENIYPYTGKDFLSLCYLDVDKNDKTHYFVTSLRDGLYEFRNDAFYKRYNTSNSTLQVASTVSAKDDYITVCGVALDNNNRLWVSNELCSQPVKVMLEDGTWRQYSYANVSNPPFMDEVLVLSNNQKWFVKPNRSYSTGGLLVLDENGVTDGTSGQKYRFISSITDQDGNTKNLGTIYDLAEDKDGNVWVASEYGVFEFTKVENVFSGTYKVIRPKISRNDGTNYADYLLDAQVVRAIAVDAGNRKWIGTNSSGVYLMSSDGLTEIHHFTEENSPLLSDQVLDIAVNDETGEVFIATANGLASYRSDATESNSDLDDIKAFPNPVRPDFGGVVTITGLMDGAIVKITDAAGNIVCQTKAYGGEATWNLRDLNGRSVASGVYAIMASESDGGKERGAGKVLVIR